MSEHLAHRVEISGGFSGSAYRYHSFLSGTLEGVHAFLSEMWSSPPEATIMVTEGFTAVLEVIHSGERRSRCSLLPALTLIASGRTLTFSGDGVPVLDGVLLDWNGLQERLDEVIDAFCDAPQCAVRLALEEPEGEPLAEGASLEVTSVSGHTHAQVCGVLFGDHCEAYAFAPT